MSDRNKNIIFVIIIIFSLLLNVLMFNNNIAYEGLLKTYEEEGTPLEGIFLGLLISIPLWIIIILIALLLWLRYGWKERIKYFEVIINKNAYKRVFR